MYDEIASLRLELEDARGELLAKDEIAKTLESKIGGYRAARIAYASEFPLDANGDPDTGSIHENIRKMKAENARLHKALDQEREVNQIAIREAVEAAAERGKEAVKRGLDCHAASAAIRKVADQGTGK